MDKWCVRYIGTSPKFKGLKGEVKNASSNPLQAMVEWDNGCVSVHNWSEVCTERAAAITPRRAQASDPVNQPHHYQFFPDLEAIEVIARSTTQEQFYGYCLGNRLKYRLRAGNKDKLEQDIAKSDKYLELYEEYKGLCYGAGDDVIAPVPMPNPEDW